MKVGDLIAFNFDTFAQRFFNAGRQNDEGVYVGLVTENLLSGGIMIRWLDNNEEDFVSNGNISQHEWEVLSESR